MNCNEIEQQLADYLGDELSAPVVKAFDVHLAACEICRREVESLGQTIHALNRLNAPPAPVPIRTRRRMGKLQPFAYAATLLIGLGVGWWIKPVDVQSPPIGNHAVATRSESPPADHDWTDAVLARYAGRSASTPFAKNAVKLVQALSASPRY